VRAFLAVPADPAWVESALRLSRRLQEFLPRASWTRPGTWHLTLKFLGEVSEEAAASFAGRIEPEILRRPGLELPPAVPVVFSSRGRPRVLAIGFEPSPALDALAELARAADEVAAAVGVPPEGRDFHPHVTLARLRDAWSPASVEAFASEATAWEFPRWRASGCVLFRSRLDSGGAVHTPVREWRFVGEPQEVRA
jgi:2'-5' RNA ligase